ncbi:MAG: hypothetical protein ACI4LM_03840 [Anaerovoracaceae bacterium]
MARQNHSDDAAKRGYNEKMKRLAEKMQPTGSVINCAKWDDDLGVLLVRLAESKAVVVYGTIKGFDIHVRPEEPADEKSENDEDRDDSGDIFTEDQPRVSKTIMLYRDDPYEDTLAIPYDSELAAKLIDIMDDLAHYRNLARRMTLLEGLEDEIREEDKDTADEGAYSPEALESSLDDDDDEDGEPGDFKQFMRDDLDTELFDS